MARSKKGNEELKDACSHLYYEYVMFRSVVSGILSCFCTKGWLANAMIESFVIHLRVLIDFFYPSGNPREDDVIAGDYFDDTSNWESIRPAISGLLDEARKRAHKDLAHLTYTRISRGDEEKKWAFSDLINELDCLMKLFQRKASKNALCPQLLDLFKP